MDLELATLQDIASELTKRNQPFMLLLPGVSGGDGSDEQHVEMHCHGMPAKDCLNLIGEASSIFEVIVNGGPVPENVIVTERMIKNGEVCHEQTIELKEGETIDPWDSSWHPRKSEQSDYDPWKVE